MMKFLALTSYLLARIWLTLISPCVITRSSQKVNFQEFNLVVLNLVLPPAFLYGFCEELEKQAVLGGNNSEIIACK